MDLDPRAVQVAIRWDEEMNFAAKPSSLGPECRARTDIEERGMRRGAGEISDERTGDIDAVVREEDIRGDREIRGRVPELSPDLIAGGYVADQHGWSSEKQGSSRNIAFGEQGSDAGAVDQLAVDENRRDNGHREPEVLAQRPKSRRVPSAQCAEPKRRSDDDGLRTQPLPQDPPGELRRGQVANLGERGTEDPVDRAEEQAVFD